MKEEILNNLSFSENDSAVSVLVDESDTSDTSNETARVIELEKKIKYLAEKIEEVSNCFYSICKRMDSIEKTHNNYFDTASKNIENKFENLESTYRKKLTELFVETEDK